MKKTISLLLSALLILSLAACTNSAAGTGTAAAETTAAVDEAAASATVAATESEGLSDAAAIHAIFESLDLTEPETLGTVKKLGQYKDLDLVGDEAKQIGD